MPDGRYRVSISARVVLDVPASEDPVKFAETALRLAWPAIEDLRAVAERVIREDDWVIVPTGRGDREQYARVVALQPSGRLVAELPDGSQRPLQKARPA